MVSQTTEPATRHAWPTAFVLAGAMFLVLFDSLAVATALPAIGEDFDIAPATLQWVVTGYSLSIGGFLVLAGRVCDVWGKRRLIVASLLLTAAGLLVSGVAPGLALLLTGRVMQGVGAAFAIPAALASAATLFPGEPWRSRVFSVVAGAANTAGLAGAVLGGLITSYLGWRWIFLVVVPVAAVAVAAALAFLPADPPAAGPRERLDVTGAVLVTGGLLAVILGATRIGEQGLRADTVLPVAAGLLMLGVLVRWARRVPHPLIKPAVVRSRRLISSCLAFGAHSSAYAVIVVVGSLQLQDTYRLSAAQAGLVLAPVLLGALFSAVPAARWVRRYGTRLVVALALLLCTIMLVLVAAASAHSLTLLTICLVAWGFSAGPIYVGLTRECIGDADPPDRGMASALFESTTHVGGALSVALFLTMLGAGAPYRATQLIAAAVVGASVLSTLVIMPRHSGDRY
ncbi:MFS transporter [Paractinoplanes toevensis]|uniref:MFS transporter n=1 Tax=Paractinoplanes toevensis TaxID=571911 RepID=A0A919T913_9ACTN|nr:MFS transporter [Actinoplanes toevensis]GIM91093.1 MFS transporter [Actinoplanes toevensis]